MFENGVPNELSGERIVLVFPDGSFYGRQAQRPGAIDALKETAAAILGSPPEIEITFASKVQGTTLAAHEAAQIDDRQKALKEAALNHPRVQQAIKVFPQVASKVEVQVDPE